MSHEHDSVTNIHALITEKSKWIFRLNSFIFYVVSRPQHRFNLEMMDKEQAATNSVNLFLQKKQMYLHYVQTHPLKSHIQ